ncbi:MAG: hypothetical protein JWP78_877 [Mucilaginibacter sp.]|nr:hypothetical protein [Mucilaginibacter sp.]
MPGNTQWANWQAKKDREYKANTITHQYPHFAELNTLSGFVQHDIAAGGRF